MNMGSNKGQTPEVCILLSTYNGVRFLREQINSVLAQEGVNVRIIVRDDGSKDATVDILKEYVSNNTNIVFIQGTNKGVEESFYALLKASFSNGVSDYYAFCDQDDIWYPNKLYSAIKELEGETIPALYCANQLVTDSNLTPVSLMLSPEERDALKERMQSNYFPNRHGCTMVWNNLLQKVLRGIDATLDFTPAHDVWLNLVAHCSGRVILGEQALQLYRIHNMNVAGLADSKIKRFKKGVKIYWLQDNRWSDYAKACIEYFPKDIQEGEGWDFLEKVAAYRSSIRNKMILVKKPQFWNTGVASGIFRAISVFIEKY